MWAWRVTRIPGERQVVEGVIGDSMRQVGCKNGDPSTNLKFLHFRLADTNAKLKAEVVTGVECWAVLGIKCRVA